MLKVIELPEGGRLIVEVEPSDEKISKDVVDHLSGVTLDDNSRRPGAEPVSTCGKIRKASEILQDQIIGLGSLAKTAIVASEPSEVTIEAHVKFGGDLNLVPFLASATGEGGLKITLKWKTG